MKFDIVAVFFTILAVPHCESALDGTGPGSRKISFQPEKSLGFITDTKELLSSTGLVTPRCAITLKEPLTQYVNKKITSGQLYIGVGAQNANINNKQFLHNVISVISNEGLKEAAGLHPPVAIVIFELDVTKIPQDLQFIPAERATYGQHFQIVKDGWAVMWNKFLGIRSENFAKSFVSKDVKHSIDILMIPKANSLVNLDDACLGGFVTQNNRLAGILYNYPKPKQTVDKFFMFVRIFITQDFVNKVPPENKLNAEDFFKTYHRVNDATGKFSKWVSS